MKLAVNEIFGPTFQGEGKTIGKPVMFLRLSGCNLACVWCDTPYTWDWTGKNGVKYDPKTETRMMEIPEIALELSGCETSHNLVISGGEPFLQQKNLIHLINWLKDAGWYIEIETAGTIAPTPDNYADQFTVSLKLEHSGNPLDERRKPLAIIPFVQDSRSIFKFVVTQESDFDEIDLICKAYEIDPSRVWIMPEGINAEAINQHSQQIAGLTLKHGYNLTTRLQVLLYGNRRAV